MIEKKGVYVGYRIICGECNKVKHSKYKPEHFICSCGKKLMWFGENVGCEIMENKKVYPKQHLRRILQSNLNKMNTYQKIDYFKEKYSHKQ